MYLFYIDESGNLDPSLETPDGRTKDHIYVLTACGMWEGKWNRFYMDIASHKNRKIREIKSKTSEDLFLEECEVKSTHLRIPKERKRSKFLRHLDEQELIDLRNLYYSSLSNHNMVICAVVIDKRHLESHFDRVKLHRKAWELLCERIVNFINEFHPKHKVILIKDDVSREANAELARKNSWFLANRTSANLSLKPLVEMPLFTKSEMNEGLQLADLCAYNIYRAFKYEDFEYEYFKIILPYFCVSGRSNPTKIDGLKVFPDQSPLVQKAKKISPC